MRTAAVILSGGRATRMGGADKGLAPLAGEPLAVRIAERLRAMGLEEIWLSANRSLGTWRKLFPRVVTDGRTDFPGPLAGMAAALRSTDADALLCVPCDSPFVPMDLAQRLGNALEASPGALAAAASTPDGRQPVFCLLRRQCLPAVEEALSRGERRVRRFLEERSVLWVDFEDASAFANCNTPEELRQAGIRWRKEKNLS